MNFDDFLTQDIKRVLLVYPDFPIPQKSKNHHNFLPIGLLKIASYLRSLNIKVELIHFHENEEIHDPDLICVGSLFTYWSKYVKDIVQYYKNKYPSIPIITGGIYASLLPDHCKSYTKCDGVITGIIPEAEKLRPAYDLVDVDYQILHTTRGCIRNCDFCGTYKIEPNFLYKKSIKKEIFKKRLIFYDNNFLANPYIHNILDELIILRNKKRINYCDAQSGVDGRLLIKDPSLAIKLKKAGFKTISIAWDHGFKDHESIHDQIKILIDSGFKPHQIKIFMIYNYKISYNEMEDKRVKCFEWGVQINDCRYRPLTLTHDNYNPHKPTSEDYYIYPSWTNQEVRSFRRNVRRQNICIRSKSNWYSYKIESKKITKDQKDKLLNLKIGDLKEKINDLWIPSYPHYIHNDL